MARVFVGRIRAVRCRIGWIRGVVRGGGEGEAEGGGEGGEEPGGRGAG